MFAGVFILLMIIAAIQMITAWFYFKKSRRILSSLLLVPYFFYFMVLLIYGNDVAVLEVYINRQIFVVSKGFFAIHVILNIFILAKMTEEFNKCN